MSANIAKVEELIMVTKPAFEARLTDKAIIWDSEAGFALQAMQANSYLMTSAYNNPASLQAAIVNIAAIGISLNPAAKQAYLVPRKVNGHTAVCLDISYMGLMHLAQTSGAIQWGQAKVVRANDTFELVAIDAAPIHKYSPFATDEDRGPIVGAYCVVKTAEGDYLTHPMAIKEIHAIRTRSEAFKAGKGPWVTDYLEMVKKTVIKQASKYWPYRERLADAIHYLDTDGGEGIKLGDESRDITPASESQQTQVSALLESLGRTWDQFAPKFKKGAVQHQADLTAEEATKVIDFLSMTIEKRKEAANVDHGTTAQAA